MPVYKRRQHAAERFGGYEHEWTEIPLCENQFSKSTRLTVSPAQTGESAIYTEDKTSVITFTQLLKLEGTVLSYCGGACLCVCFTVRNLKR